MCYNTQDKVNAFAKFFQSVHSQNVDLGVKSHDKKVKSVVNKFLKANSGKNQFVDILTIPRKVLKDLKKLKNNKAPGFDLITGVIIKHLPRKAIVMLTKIVNGMMLLGYF